MQTFFFTPTRSTHRTLHDNTFDRRLSLGVGRGGGEEGGSRRSSTFGVVVGVELWLR